MAQVCTVNEKVASRLHDTAKMMESGDFPCVQPGPSLFQPQDVPRTDGAQHGHKQIVVLHLIAGIAKQNKKAQKLCPLLHRGLAKNALADPVGELR